MSETRQSEARNPAMSVGIFYFSGTGNTEAIAEAFVAAFRRRGATADLARMEPFTQKREAPGVGLYDVIGIGYPIHAFNAPRIVFEFIDLLPAGRGRRAFLFKCPGDPFVNGGSTHPVRRRLSARGYDVVHESMLVMPANLAVKYPPEMVKELYDIACRRMAFYTREILAGIPRLQGNGWMERLFTLLSPVERFGARMLRLHFSVRRCCTGCGLCARCCPASNIRMSHDRPCFSWRCLACLRCVYLCPVRAIGLRGFNFVLFKDGYNIRAVLDDRRTRPAFPAPGERGYYRRFLAYANDSPGGDQGSRSAAP